MNDVHDRPTRPLAGNLSLDDFLPYLLNRISSRLNADLAEELKTIGASLPIWRVLAVLHVAEGRTIGELAVYTVIEQSTLSRIVDRMEKAGLVERRPAAADARVVEVLMTADGRAMFQKIMPIAMNHYRRAVSSLSEAERDTLIGTLHRILDTIRASEFP